MAATPAICVIVPVYGNWRDTVDCLKALETQSTSEFQILIADDGSPTPPPASIQASARAQYFRNENAGYGANCNRAARHAIDQGATHLLFLNSDTSFGPDFMTRWMERVEELPEAILSPLIYWARWPEKIWSSGAKLTILSPFLRFRQNIDQVAEVDIVTGCALLVPAASWTNLGGFDPSYFMYFEDFDFTLRAKARGVRTYVLPDRQLHVLHHVSGSFRGAKVWRKHYLMVESMLIFIRRHYQGLSKAICFALAGAHLAATIVLSLPELPNPKRLWTALARGWDRPIPA